jgi:hypothetical protein
MGIGFGVGGRALGIAMTFSHGLLLFGWRVFRESRIRAN